MPHTDAALRNKVALVTGAGRGIGKAVALAYAAAGAAVACAARTQHELEATVQTIQTAGGKAIALTTDVSQEMQVQHMLKNTIEAFGGLDILLLNAGIDNDRQPVESSDPDAWRTTLEVNLIGAYLCIQAAIPHLKARGGGKIITMGSGMGHKGLAGASAYSVSKAGLWMLTRILAQELWEYNISVNELIPGPVETAMTATPGSSPAFAISSEWRKKPQDVVPLALFLATQPEIGPSAQSFSLMRRDN